MLFTITLYLSLGICALGILNKVSNWFRKPAYRKGLSVTAAERVKAAVLGIPSVLFSRKILILLRAFLLDVLFQARIFKESRLRWAMHLCIFYGFMLLFLMHALERLVSARLFEDYASTANPYFFLRSLAGALVLAGLGISITRRFIIKRPRFFTNNADRLAIFLLTVILLSGLGLEAVKITSRTEYLRMVEDYGDVSDEAEARALEAFWVKEFGLVSPVVSREVDEETLKAGREVHETSCASCHATPRWAFLGYGLSRVLVPVAPALDRAAMVKVLWTIHFLACFVGLAYLPFGRMFHVITAPLSLLANAVMDRETSDPANLATKQLLELDACTHCGTCTQRCYVGVAFEAYGNPNILPSEKMGALRDFLSGRGLGEEDRRALSQGLYLCTNCHRCTMACPVGIDLQGIWYEAREALFLKGDPEYLVLSPLSLYRGLLSDSYPPDLYKRPLTLARSAIAASCEAGSEDGKPLELKDARRDFREGVARSALGSTFRGCYTCTTCTSVCPVVREYQEMSLDLGLAPHQVIRAVVLGMPHLVYPSEMIWSCLGCYRCQEACPQGVRVTDIFFELKNRAVRNAQRSGQEVEEAA